MSFFPNAARPAAVGLAWLLAGAALAGCAKDHDTDCLKSNGRPVTQRRAVSRQLRRVTVFTNVDLIVVPDTAVYAEVTAGEHVIDQLEFSTPGGPRQLEIRNTSTCNWVRSYDTPREVRLHLPNFGRRFDVVQAGYGQVSTAGRWAQDTLFLRILSPGDLQADVQATYLFADIYDAGDMTLRGTAHDFHPGLSSNGFMFTGDLRADLCYFFTYPSWIGNAHVRPLQALGGTMRGSGTLFYAGAPPYVNIDGPNAGRAVRE